MSIDIKDAIKAIKESVQIMDPDEEYITIASAEEQMSMTEAARKKEIDEARTKMKGEHPRALLRAHTSNDAYFQALAKALEAARISSTRPASVPSAEAHQNTLNKLEDARLSLAKAINEMESSLASKESEKAQLREELHRLEESDPAAEHQLDSTALRLALFKGLGFEPIMEGDRMIKIIVRKEVDTYIVDLRNDKTSFEAAQQLWKLATV
ncbi:hypothetical protein NM688_g2932 [Phlebia brevispora]|uniref:Uncharacterized protein n=1 Tax=Phlebia brevispora TaxID=194682 RepID=A0ACC1T749_9APHY|nr:hypothetical protein NM688_g2932 [Phlebia brevispora]